MAKNQPKLTDMTEILLQQVIQLEQTIKKSEKTHLDTIKELSNIKVPVNIAELRQIEKEQRQRLQNDFEKFNREITKNNEDLLKVHKAISNTKIFYLIALNIFLLFTSGISMYIAINKSIDNSDYNQLIENNKKSDLELNQLNQFFKENPKNYEMYKKWDEKSKSNFTNSSYISHEN